VTRSSKVSPASKAKIGCAGTYPSR
jgi:hypothetical protein